MVSDSTCVEVLFSAELECDHWATQKSVRGDYALDRCNITTSRYTYMCWAPISNQLRRIACYTYVIVAAVLGNINQVTMRQ